MPVRKAKTAWCPAGKVGGAPAPDDQQYTFTIQLQGRLTSVQTSFAIMVIKTHQRCRWPDSPEAMWASVELGGETATSISTL